MIVEYLSSIHNNKDSLQILKENLLESDYYFQLSIFESFLFLRALLVFLVWFAYILQVHLKIKYHDFIVSNRSLSLEHPTCDKLITKEAISILLKKTKVGKKAVRLLGVSFSNLSSHQGIVTKGIQKPLFPMET